MLRTLSFFLMMAFMSLKCQASTVFPEVSTDGNEHWYYIQMQNGMAVLAARSENSRVVTAEATESQAKRQLWKIVAEDGNHYRLISQGGQTLYYDVDDGMFRSKAAPTSGFAVFQIVPTTCAGYEGYELFVDKKGDMAKVLDFIENYEFASWQELSRLMIVYNIKEGPVYDAYTEALSWYRDLFGTVEEKK